MEGAAFSFSQEDTMSNTATLAADHSQTTTQPPAPRKSPRLAQPTLDKSTAGGPRRTPNGMPGTMRPTPVSPTSPLEPPAGPVDFTAAIRPPADAADVIHDYMIPVYLATAMAFDKRITPMNYRTHLDRLLADAGNPTDPCEVVLIEQMAMTHLRSARLHALADGRGTPEAVKIYDGTAARLPAEVQKIITTLEKYRASKAPRRLRGSAASWRGKAD